MRMPKVLFPPVVLLLLAAGCKEKPAAAPATPKVEVVTVLPRDVPIYQEWIGTLDGYPNAQIRAQVAGYLMKQVTRRGEPSDEGICCSRLIRARFRRRWTRPWPRSNKMRRCWARPKLDVARYTPLAKTQAVSQEQLDDAVQANLMAKAAVVADKAAVETARLNLGFTRITSPVDGVAGVAQAQIGDLVGPNTAVLTTVSTVNPIRAYFNISEQFYLAFFRPTAPRRWGTARARRTFPCS